MTENSYKKNRQLDGFLKSFTLNHEEEEIEEVVAEPEVEEPVVNFLPPAKLPAYITKEAIVEGSLSCDGDIIVEGVVNGNITGTGSVKVNGKVQGNVKGGKVEMAEAEIIGDVEAGDYVLISGGTIQGSITAGKADINGLIKGNITTSEMLVIQQNASIEGDIKTASISVAQNAIINGKVTIAREFFHKEPLVQSLI